jgi:hypothetical protein
MKNIHNFYKARLSCDDQRIWLEASLPDTFSFDVGSQYEAPFAQGFGGGTNISAMLRLGGLSLTNQAMTAQVWQGTSDVRFTIPFIFQADTDAIQDVVKPIKDLMRLALPKVGKTGGLLESPGPRIDLNSLVQSNQDAENINKFAAAIGTGLKDSLEAAWTGIKSLYNQDEAMLQSAVSDSHKIRGSVDTASQAFSTSITSAIRNNIRLDIGGMWHFPHVIIEDVQQTANVQPLRGTGIFQRVEVNVTFKTFMLPTSNDLEQMLPFNDR